jgi:hypothetical protein
MNYWAGLYAEIDKTTLEAGVNMMLKIALKLLNKKVKLNPQMLIEEDPEGHQEE